MKIRNGFVSNSSSTSFYIDSSKYSVEALTKILELAVETNNMKENENKALDDMLYIHDPSLCESTVKEIRAYYNHDFEGFKTPMIEISSKYDNSIPWWIQELLEDMGIRHHWG